MEWPSPSMPTPRCSRPLGTCSSYKPGLPAGKEGTLTYPGGEDVLVVDEHLDPVHEHAHVLGGRELGGFLVPAVVLPAILVPEPPGHDGAAPLGAVLAHGAIDEVDAVEKVHDVHSNPVIDALARRQLHHCPQVQPGLEGSLGFLVQLKALRARLEFLAGTEGFVFVEHLLETQGHGGQGQPGPGQGLRATSNPRLGSSGPEVSGTRRRHISDPREARCTFRHPCRDSHHSAGHTPCCPESMGTQIWSELLAPAQAPG